MAVTEAGSLTKAGALLGLPQSAISKQIARFEQECGGRLFHRTGRGMVVTDLGQRVLPRVSALLAGADELSAEVTSNYANPRGDVRIGALPSFYLKLIVPLFSMLRRHCPDIRLQVFEGSAGQIDQWLVSGYVDIGLPYRYGTQPPLDAEPLLSVESYLMGKPGNPLTRPDTVEFRQLDDVPLVLPGSPSSVRLLLDQIAKKHQIRLNVILEADSTQIQKAVAATGDAFTILPLHAAEAEVAGGRLQVSRIVHPVIQRTIALGITSARPMSAATKYVARAIREFFPAQGIARLPTSDINVGE